MGDSDWSIDDAYHYYCGQSESFLADVIAADAEELVAEIEEFLRGAGA